MLGCQSTQPASAPEKIGDAAALVVQAGKATNTPDVTRTASALIQATSARQDQVANEEKTPESEPPSPTPEPTMSATSTATATPTSTPIGPCGSRLPNEDLLTIVTLTYGISREYVPDDLIPLAEKLPMSVTMGFPSEIRSPAFEPLVAMVEAMQAQGLRPQVLSAYRSYAAQAIAWDKWNELYPEHAHIISAPPGYSEHQLGTVVDFGSPELAGIVGQEDIEFHTYFYKTSEGAWLAENAHLYGFTLSFPADASEVSGFYYEPWHYRYVGPEMATFLHEQEVSLIEYQLANHGDPCLP